MDKDYTEIAVVLDRSGSMGVIKPDVIGGFNEFVEGQKKAPGRALISLYQFDTEYECVYAGVPVADVMPRSAENYNPRGGTALLDAIGRSVNDLGERLKKLEDSKRPGLVVVVIITDGQENASKEFSREKVFQMIEHQRNAYKWQFVFLASNQDAIASGAEFGMSQGMTMSMGSDGTSFKYAASGTSSNVYAARVSASAGDSWEKTSGALLYSDEQRKKQKERGAQ